jgi:hypothetical protein
MSMFNKKAVTYDQLIDMIKAMRDANKIDSIYAEECLGGSLEIFVSAKDEEEVYEKEASYAQKEAEEKLMRKWVDEDHPEATEEQKANLTKLFREV